MAFFIPPDSFFVTPLHRRHRGHLVASALSSHLIPFTVNLFKQIIMPLLSIFSYFTSCCGLPFIGKGVHENKSTAESGCKDCTNNGQQAILDSTASTLNDSNFDVISPENSLHQIKSDVLLTPQSQEVVLIENETPATQDKPIEELTEATVVSNENDQPKKKSKKKIIRRILSLSSKKRSKLVNISTTDN